MYVPGSSPKMLSKVPALANLADSVCLDLEDAVAPNQKEQARLQVHDALQELDFQQAERVVRINSSEAASDLSVVLKGPVLPNAIFIPKVDDSSGPSKPKKVFFKVSSIFYRSFFVNCTFFEVLPHSVHLKRLSRVKYSKIHRMWPN